MKMPEAINIDMFAPCGMNCAVCYKHLLSERSCVGCLNGEQGKTQHCRKCKIKNCVDDKPFSYCFECVEYPCKQLKNLELSYRKRYRASLIENGRFVQTHNLEYFMEQQRAKYKCAECGGIISVHDNECSECRKITKP